MTNALLTIRCRWWWLFCTPLIVFSSGRPAAEQVRKDDSRPPTPIEQALGDHACRNGAATASIRSQSYQDCLVTELQTLRAAFGQSLARLTGADRKAVDSRCAALRESRGPDAYVACLSRELETLRLRRRRPAVQGAPPQADPTVAVDASFETSLEAVPESVSVPVDAPLGVPSGVWTAVAIAFAGLAVVAWLHRARTRQAAARCRGCGAALPAAGDLCPPCRRGAAESLRRPASERPPGVSPADRTGHGDQPAAWSAPGTAVPVTTGATGVETPRVSQAEAVTTDGLAAAPRFGVDSHPASQPDPHDPSLLAGGPIGSPHDVTIVVARGEETAGGHRRDVVPPETDLRARAEAFDPFRILGVSPGASPGEIEEAYQTALRKYDPEEVAHLGAELRDHFRGKADAVERAYRRLTLEKSA